MIEKKEIERLFQEKFKDFEMHPAVESWEYIESRLDKKKKRRILPIWYQVSGIAALFIIGLLLYNNSEKTFFETNNPIPVVQQPTIQPLKNENKELAKPLVEETFSIEHKNAVTSRNNSNIQAASTSQKSRFSSHSNTKSAHQNNTWANNNHQNNHYKNNNHQSTNDRLTTINSDYFNQPLLTLEQNPEASKGLVTLEKAIAIQEKNETQKDSSSINGFHKNTLGEMLHEKESKTKKESQKNGWQLTSTIAPVFWGSVSSGSPIDGALKQNQKQYNTGLNLGVGVTYQVHEKLKLRTGINKFVVDYNTNDVAFSADLLSRGLSNIDLVDNAANIMIQTGVTDNTFAPAETNIAQINNGVITQKIGYIEMPFEMSYSLINSKFDIDLITGVSTLFLNENEISLTSHSMNMVLGKANNLSSIHFSTNFGVGIRYQIIKALEYNLEPTFKYQLNTFSTNSGNFKPYIFGIYTGLSYQF